MSALHHETRGRRGRDLVLLHGWGLNLGVWRRLARELSSRFRVIAIDLPGHGRSDWDPRAVTPAAQAWRVHETIAPLTERYALLGWSLGGQFALDLASAMPAGIERLVLVGATPRFLAGPGWRSGMPPARLEEFAAALRRSPERTLQGFLAQCARGSAPRTAHRVSSALRAALAEHGNALPQALAVGLERLKEVDLRAALPMVRVPTLVIAGSRDQVTRAAASRALAARLSHARYLELAGAGHAPFLSHPARFARAVSEFLSG
jgi:pimeloyl-[acyl-carrier protein] methyl ester esterase